MKMLLRSIEAPTESEFEVDKNGITMGRNPNHKIVL